MDGFADVAELALKAAGTALEDIIEARAAGKAIDTKTLKEVTAALKDLSGIAGDSPAGDGALTVVFKGFAEEAAL